MTTLIQTLTAQTQSLKDQYISMTSDWAAKEFDTLREFVADHRAGRNGYTWSSKKYWSLPSYILDPKGKVETHIEKAVKAATMHYEESIEKLAARIEKKGLDQSSIKIETTHLGVNIETVLTDGKKTVRAFTIIAQGEIQRPHYRYLVK